MPNMKPAKLKGDSSSVDALEIRGDAHTTAHKPEEVGEPWSSDEDDDFGDEMPSVNDEEDKDGVAKEESSRRRIMKTVSKLCAISSGHPNPILSKSTVYRKADSINILL